MGVGKGPMPPRTRSRPEPTASSLVMVEGACRPRGGPTPPDASQRSKLSRVAVSRVPRHLARAERHPSCLPSLRRGSSRLAGEVLKQDAGHPHRVSGAVAPIGGLRPLSLARSLCAQLPGPGVNRIAREGRPPSASHDPKLPASRSPSRGSLDLWMPRFSFGP